MKTGYTLLCILLTSVVGTIGQRSFAQIPNAGYENWLAGDPVDWNTSNIPPTVVNVTQGTQSHSGSFAVHGEVVDFPGFAWAPTLISGSQGQGFPVSAQHPAVHGWYKFSPVGGDQLFVTAGMVSGDSAVGAGAFTTMALQNAYAELIVDIFYTSPTLPDTGIISFTIFGPGGGLPHIGSTLDMDDLSFGPATGITEDPAAFPETFTLFQDYPNPFNPSTQIRYALPHAGQVTLKVFNMLGQEVASLVDEHQEAGVYRTEFEGANLPSGAYFYRLQSGKFSQTKKLILLR